jgi:hypothetical protein
MSVEIQAMTEADWQPVREIYLEGLPPVSPASRPTLLNGSIGTGLHENPGSLASGPPVRHL